MRSQYLAVSVVIEQIKVRFLRCTSKIVVRWVPLSAPHFCMSLPPFYFCSKSKDIFYDPEPFIIHLLHVSTRTPEREVTHNHVHLQTNRTETPKPYLFTPHNATHPTIYPNARRKAAPKTPFPHAKKRTNLTPTCCL